MKTKKLLCIGMSIAMIFGLVACGQSAAPATDQMATETTDVESSVAETTTAESTVAETSSETVAEIGTGKVVSDKEATLSLYTHYNGDNMAPADWAVEQVKKEFPNVTLEIESVQDDGKTIATRAATGDLPDIIQITQQSLDVLVKSESIIALDDYVDQTKFRDKLTDSSIANQLTSADGHIYQYPDGDASPILWYYNQKLFDDNNIKVPTNYDELMTAIDEFNKAGIIPFSLFAKEAWPTCAFADSFILKSTDNGVMDLADNKAKASDEGYKKGIEKMRKALDAGMLQQGATNADFDTAAALFKEGKAAMFLNGSWFISDAESAMGDDCKAFTAYPTADAGEEEATNNIYINSGGFAGHAVSANTEDPDLTAKVAASYTYWLLVGKYQMLRDLAVPIKTEDLETPELTAMNQQLLDMMHNGTLKSQRSNYYNNTEFGVSFTEEMQKFVVGEDTDSFIKNVDGIISSVN